MCLTTPGRRPPRSKPPSPSGGAPADPCPRLRSATSWPLRRRRGVGAGRLARHASCPSRLPHRQVGPPERGAPSGAGAQRRDAGPGSPHRPPRPRVVPPAGTAGCSRVDAGHRQRSGGGPRRGRGRAGHTGGRHREPGRRGRRAVRRPGGRVRRGVARRFTIVHALRARTAGRRGGHPRSGCRHRPALDVVRDRRDGTDGALHGRRERRTVRAVCLRSARTGRRPRAPVGRSVRRTGARADRAPGATGRRQGSMSPSRRRGAVGAERDARVRGRCPRPCPWASVPRVHGRDRF